MTQEITNNPLFRAILYLSIGTGSIYYFVVKEIGKAFISTIFDVVAGPIAIAAAIGITLCVVKAKKVL